MRNSPISRTFYLSLLEFLMAGKQHLITIGGEFGLTGLQAVTLMLIDESRPRPMKSFCTLYHCDASNVTGIIDGLEKKGLVSRRNDPNDRRIKVIRLEPAGRHLQQAIIERLNTDTRFLFDPLNDTETQQFARLLKKITAAANPSACTDKP